MSLRKITVVLLFALAASSALLVGCDYAKGQEEADADSSFASVASSSEQKSYGSTELEASASVATDKSQTESTANCQQLDDTEEYKSGICTVNVDSKDYTFYVGDELTYVFYLEAPEMLEDFQAATYYDSSMLEFTERDEGLMFPVAGNAVIYNFEMPNILKYNAVNINGMDFTSKGQLVSFCFKVIDSGGTAISTTLEYMDSVKSEPYVSNYKIIGAIKYSEEII